MACHLRAGEQHWLGCCGDELYACVGCSWLVGRDGLNSRDVEVSRHAEGSFGVESLRNVGGSRNAKRSCDVERFRGV
jgi:hypothetical protein